MYIVVDSVQTVVVGDEIDDRVGNEEAEEGDDQSYQESKVRETSP